MNSSTQIACDDIRPSSQRSHYDCEWIEHGDPRCLPGHFRPKVNLRSLYVGPDKIFPNKECLAEALGVSSTSIANWASGKRYMMDRHIIRCALMAHVSIPWLLDLESNPNAQRFPKNICAMRQSLISAMREVCPKNSVNLAADYHFAVEAGRTHQKVVDDLALLLFSNEEPIATNKHDCCSEGSKIFELCLERAYEMLGAGDPVIDELCYECDNEDDLPSFVQPERRRLGAADALEITTLIERDFPGDYRDSSHLAMEMLKVAMRMPEDYQESILSKLSTHIMQAAGMGKGTCQSLI